VCQTLFPTTTQTWWSWLCEQCCPQHMHAKRRYWPNIPWVHKLGVTKSFDVATGSTHDISSQYTWVGEDTGTCLTKISLIIFDSPVMMTSEAPQAFAVSRQTSPIGPAPHTSTLLPSFTPARWHAWTPTLSGSRRAPSSNVTWSGSLYEDQDDSSWALIQAFFRGGGCPN
jgi:hypothetical protein